MSGMKPPQNDANKVDASKIIDKMQQIVNTNAINFKSINELLEQKLSILDTINTGLLTPSNSDSLDDFLKEIKESFNSQRTFLEQLKNIISTNQSSSIEMLGKLKDISNSTLDKQVTSAFTILNSKIDNQSATISQLINSTSKEDVDLGDSFSLVTQKLTTIEENQSTDVISILEKIGLLEQQTLINVQVNSELLNKIQPLENYLLTMVKGLTTLYERNNELKVMQKYSIDKIDGLTEMLTSLINTEAETQSEPIENIENTAVKVNVLTRVKTFLKSLPTAFLKWRIS